MLPEHWLYTISLRLRSLFRRAEADQELDDELRDHLERKTEEYVAQGLMQEEARGRTRLELGGIEQTKEKCRDARRVSWIQDFIQDVRYGARVLRIPGDKSPFTPAKATKFASRKCAYPWLSRIDCPARSGMIAMLPRTGFTVIET